MGRISVRVTMSHDEQHEENSDPHFIAATGGRKFHEKHLVETALIISNTCYSSWKVANQEEASWG
jgi:hypothetical protein